MTTKSLKDSKKSFLNNFIPTKKINKTIKNAATGKNIDVTETNDAVAVSVVETIGLAKPPVVAVDANRVLAVAVFKAAAVPPPAIMANPQVSIGSKSTKVDAIAIVPAILAKGMAIESSKLSTNGI